MAGEAEPTTRDRNRTKTKAALLSVLSNGTLIVLKVAVGLAIGSVSVLSEAIHSAMDLLASLIAFVAVRTSGKPADREHPFGHGKAENISGAVEALLIFLAAGWILYEAAWKFVRPEPVRTPLWGVAVMLLSAGTNAAVSRMLFRVSRETESIALEADGWHLRTDVWTSAGVMGSLGAIWIGGILFPDLNLHWLDPAAAVAVALLIVRAAWRLTVQSTRDLMDTNLPPEEERRIRDVIENRKDIIKGYHRFRSRRSGTTRFVDFHIKVDPAMTVERSHKVGEEISEAIRRLFAGANVTIHVEPCDGRCARRCISGCFLDEEERLRIRATRARKEK